MAAELYDPLVKSQAQAIAALMFDGLALTEHIVQGCAALRCHM
jgi:hypothetical protein